MLEVARNRLLALLDLDSIAIELELRECMKVTRQNHIAHCLLANERGSQYYAIKSEEGNIQVRISGIFLVSVGISGFLKCCGSFVMMSLMKRSVIQRSIMASPTHSNNQDVRVFVQPIPHSCRKGCSWACFWVSMPSCREQASCIDNQYLFQSIHLPYLRILETT